MPNYMPNMPNEKAGLEELSWEFLPKITDEVTKMHQQVQKQIMQYGRVMRDAGAVYVHVIDAVKLVKIQSLLKSQSQIDNNKISK